MAKVRLDSLLAERGLFESRSRAAAAVMAGEVQVASRLAEQAVAARGRRGVDIVVAAAPAYVSRGGVKLANALDALGVPVAGRSCLDVGASTGGFTDCLLQRGAARVIALDVAYGELDYRLRQDARVTVIERTNARSRRLAAVPSLPDRDRRLVHLADARCCPPCWRSPTPAFDCLAMVKPQFEVGRDARGQGRRGARPELRREAVASVAACGASLGCSVLGFAPSGLPGPKGNLETFVWLAEGARAGASRLGAALAEVAV